MPRFISCCDFKWVAVGDATDSGAISRGVQMGPDVVFKGGSMLDFDDVGRQVFVLPKKSIEEEDEGDW